MLSRAARLNTKTFAQAFANGKTARHPLLSVRVLRVAVLDVGVLPCTEKSGPVEPESGDETAKKVVRAAFVVPKKQAKAARRNLVRRRMRDCYRQHPALSQRQNDLQKALQGCDLIFVATPAAHNASWEQLNEAFAQLLRRAARLANEIPKTSAPKRNADSSRSAN